MDQSSNGLVVGVKQSRSGETQVNYGKGTASVVPEPSPQSAASTAGGNGFVG
jgi:hypothetical protein